MAEIDSAPVQTEERGAVAMATEAMAANDVVLGLGNATVMRDITVSFLKGTITALVGPSGSGKTTFLRSLIPPSTS